MLGTEVTCKFVQAIWKERILVIKGEYAGSKGGEGLFRDDATWCQSGAFEYKELVDKNGSEEECTVCRWR